ncbi:MAG TPA: hypothetical protein VE029_04230 [Rhizobacter sp.]|nr:hypothetical protein [Rhizobacter sp.]
MTKNDRPETLGVFMPVGHVVVSFPSAADMDAAARALAGAGGFLDEEVLRYSPEQMKAQVDRDVARASPFVSLGQELNLVKAHRTLAERGYSFLVVHAPKDKQTQRVVDIVKRFHAERAQKYGHFMIEELIEQGDDLTQIFESPARGLDVQTRSGSAAERKLK